MTLANSVERSGVVAGDAEIPDMETSVKDGALSGAGIGQQPQNGARERESRAAPKEWLNISIYKVLQEKI
jgi:hypothetical protein